MILTPFQKVQILARRRRQVQVAAQPGKTISALDFHDRVGRRPDGTVAHVPDTVTGRFPEQAA